MSRVSVCIAIATLALSKGIMIPAIFRDGMVLQTPAASIFGYAILGEEVILNMSIPGYNNVTYHTTSNATTGKWSVYVSAPPDNPTPTGVVFSIKAASDTTPTTISDAAFGEVFFCNGQV